MDEADKVACPFCEYKRQSFAMFVFTQPSEHPGYAPISFRWLGASYTPNYEAKRAGWFNPNGLEE